jgi:CO/xanthine dehydrogenase Mo-binding subunit
VVGPPVSSHLRAVGLAEQAVLVAGALDRDLEVVTPSGARARAIVSPRADGTIERVTVEVAAGDPLDEVVLRSYAIGAAHMAIGWVCSEHIVVDPETGEIHDLTIRSFGIVRAKDMPPVDVTVLDDAAPARARASDAVFAAVAASTWNALTRAEGRRPDTFPARDTRAARRLRR